MKRLSLLFMSVLLVIGLMTSVAYAQGAEKIDMVEGDTSLDKRMPGEEDASGFAIINYTPKGATDLVVQLKVDGLLPEWEYEVKSGGSVIGDIFMTNKRGKATFHYNFSSDEADSLGSYINVWNVESGDRVLRAMLQE